MNEPMDILSERLEDGKAAAKWAEELSKRCEKSEEITKELMAKYVPMILRRKNAAHSPAAHSL